MKRLNILCFPGGTEIAHEVRAALCFDKSISVFGASSDSLDGGTSLYCAYKNNLPYISAGQKFIEALNFLVQIWAIDYIIPCHDDALLFLSVHTANLNGKVMAPDARTVEILRSKIQTLGAVKGFIPIPEIYDYSKLRAGEIAVDKIFVKPDIGQGAYDTHVLCVAELDRFRDCFKSYLFSEYLTGEEFTVDCLSDGDANIVVTCPRKRDRMKSGIATHTTSSEDPIFNEYSQILSHRFKLRGAWFYQMKRDRDGQLKLLEIAPRIAGTMGLHRMQGINFPRLSLYAFEGQKIKILRNPIGPRVLSRTFRSHARYDLEFESAFVDLDDTLIIKDRVNGKLIGLIYQWLGEGRKVNLITRHKGDPSDCLRRFRLNGLFDNVIHLTQGEPKSLHVAEKDVLIDDSFTERLEVENSVRARTFDLSMIDCLIDERVR